MIAASEDVGLADSNALRVALDAARAAEMVGMPEARIPLAHATVYLATAPKSNSAYMGINAAMNDVRNGKTLAVPEHLRTPTRKKMAAAGGRTPPVWNTCIPTIIRSITFRRPTCRKGACTTRPPGTAWNYASANGWNTAAKWRKKP